MMSCWRMKNLPSAEIQLEKNDRKSVYFTGETISGKLILHTNESISYDDLRFSFIGNSEEVLKSVPFTMPTISITRNTLLYETVIHLSLPSTENNSLIDTETSKAIHPLFSFPFTLTIPNDLPLSTYGTSCTFDRSINYYLVLKYIRPEKEPKEIQKLPIYVLPRVLPPENQTNIESLGTNRDGLSVRIQMNPGYIFSDKPRLPLEITIDNPKGQKINKIKYQLVRKYEMGAYRDRMVLLDSTIPGVSNCREKHLHEKFVLPISRSILELPPTHSYSSKSHPAHDVHNYYTLKIECCVNGFSTNIKLKMPIFIANEQ